MTIDVVCLGEALVDIFAPVGVSLKDAQTFERAPGGAPANVAAALGKLGVRVGFVGKVGDDPFGYLLQETLVDAHVDITHLHLARQARTTLAWVAKPDVDTSEFLFYRNPGADALLQPDDLDRVYLQQARIFHFGSVSLSLEPARSATLQAATIARQAGGLISYDPNWRPFLWPGVVEGRTWILKGLAFADLVKVNETELEVITGETDFVKGSCWLLDQGVKLVITTCGVEGSYFANRQASSFVSAFQVQAVDATGCGDAFVAGLLAQLLELDRPLEYLDELSLRTALRFANAAGALTATRKGVIPALPTRADIETFLARI
jgi:fructokinase